MEINNSTNKNHLSYSDVFDYEFRILDIFKDNQEFENAFNYFKINNFLHLIFYTDEINVFYKDISFIFKNLSEIFSYFLDIEYVLFISKKKGFYNSEAYYKYLHIKTIVRKVIYNIEKIHEILEKVDKILKLRDLTTIELLLFNCNTTHFLKENMDYTIYKYSCELLLDEKFRKQNPKERKQAIIGLKKIILKDFNFDLDFNEFISQKLDIDNNLKGIEKIKKMDNIIKNKNKIKGLYDKRYKNRKS